jgi:hypothetical protein
MLFITQLKSEIQEVIFLFDFLLRSQCDTIKLSVKDEHIPIKLPFPYQINKVSVHYYTNTSIQTYKQ